MVYPIYTKNKSDIPNQKKKKILLLFFWFSYSLLYTYIHILSLFQHIYHIIRFQCTLFYYSLITFWGCFIFIHYNIYIYLLFNIGNRVCCTDFVAVHSPTQTKPKTDHLAGRRPIFSFFNNPFYCYSSFAFCFL